MTVEDDFDAHYSDDPQPETRRSSTRFWSGFLVFILLIGASTYYLGTTVSGTLNLNAGQSMEFGQGFVATAACSGTTPLSITPTTKYTPGSPTGTWKMDSLSVSNIPSKCLGNDFTLQFYSSSTPLIDVADRTGVTSTPSPSYSYSPPSPQFINTIRIESFAANSSTPNYAAWGGANGVTVTSSSSSFNITFTKPVALSSNVKKITIESSAPFKVGDTGPGGGTVFYVSSSAFSCGIYKESRCKYLEVAPSGWNNTASDPIVVGANSSIFPNGVTNIESQAYEKLATPALYVGIGYNDSDTTALTHPNSASKAAKNYTSKNGKFGDWYLGSWVELNLLCQFAHGQTNSTSACDGTTPFKVSGFTSGNYASSTRFSNGNMLVVNLSGKQGGSPALITTNLSAQYNSGSVRPIRAF